MNPLVVIMGPTGVGKSAVAARVAAECGGEIVCADSRQLYRGIDVGAALPAPDERSRAPHHLYGALDPAEDISAGKYRGLAAEAIAGISRRGRLPLLVGGTGLYIRAVLQEWTLAPPAKPETLREFDARAEREGNVALWRELAAADPAAARRVGRNDRYRIVRALAVMRDTGRTLTTQRGGGGGAYDPLVRVALDRPRDALNAAINARCERMMAEGMIGEAERLKASGLSREAPVLKAIGYLVLFEMLEGRLTREAALALIQRDSRRYAKRQLTWLRSQKGFTWIEASNADCAVAEVLGLIRTSVGGGV